MTTQTDLSKKQLARILSALDDAPRSPANKGEALRAIGRSAERIGLRRGRPRRRARPARRAPHPGRVPRRAAGPTRRQRQRHGRRAAARDGRAGGRRGGYGAPGRAGGPALGAGAGGGRAGASRRRDSNRRGRTRCGPCYQARPAHRHQAGADDRDAPASRGRHRRADRRRHRLAASHHPRRHQRRAEEEAGAIEATRTREVGPNKSGAKGSSTVYRITGSSPATEPA
jgi:hypothetical protein